MSEIATCRKLLKRLIAVDTGDPNLALVITALQESAKLALDNIRPGQDGSPHLVVARKRAADSRRERMLVAQAMIKPIIAKLRAVGKSSYREIAEALDVMGIKPAKGGKWSVSSVRWIENSDAPDTIMIEVEEQDENSAD